MREASEHKFGGGGGGGREDVSSKDLEFGVTGDGGKNYFELRVGNGTGGVLGGRNWGLADRGMVRIPRQWPACGSARAALSVSVKDTTPLHARQNRYSGK